jgi:peptidoglycan/LPS O-acetylase OafA/YrhL
VVGLGVLLFALKKRRELGPQEPNYRSFYVMGIILLCVGLASIIVYLTTDITLPTFPVIVMPFFGLGAAYLAIGLANRDKWERRKRAQRHGQQVGP